MDILTIRIMYLFLIFVDFSIYVDAPEELLPRRVVYQSLPENSAKRRLPRSDSYFLSMREII